MIKRTALLTLLALAPLGLAQGSDRGAARLAVGGKTFAIDYGRPSLKGRDMLGQAKIGDEWRMGSNAATTWKADGDVAFGAVNVAQGEYQLRARRDGEDKWTLLFKQDGKTVAEVPLALSSVKDSVETLTIDLREAKGGGEFDMRWGTTSLKAAFKLR
jgi:hypothetical protein